MSNTVYPLSTYNQVPLGEIITQSGGTQLIAANSTPTNLIIAQGKYVYLTGNPVMSIGLNSNGFTETQYGTDSISLSALAQALQNTNSYGTDNVSLSALANGLQNSNIYGNADAQLNLLNNGFQNINYEGMLSISRFASISEGKYTSTVISKGSYISASTSKSGYANVTVTKQTRQNVHVTESRAGNLTPVRKNE